MIEVKLTLLTTGDAYLSAPLGHTEVSRMSTPWKLRLAFRDSVNEATSEKTDTID